MRRDMAEDKQQGGRRHGRAAAADLPVPRHDGGASVASDDDDDGSDGEFEFPFVSREPAVADELFAGGRVRASYPVFGRVLHDAAPAPSARAPLGRLFRLEQARASSVASTSSDDSSATSSSASSSSSVSAADAELLNGAPPDSYCLWAPGPSSPASSPSRPPPRKSGSTGSVARRWRRIGELVVGRSRSDGGHKFLFLSAPPSPARDGDHHHHHHHSPAGSTTKPQPPPPAKGNKSAAAGRRMSYDGGKASPGGRRTFLPYRQGLFGNAHGLSRSPF